MNHDSHCICHACREELAKGAAYPWLTKESVDGFFRDWFREVVRPKRPKRPKLTLIRGGRP